VVISYVFAKKIYKNTPFSFATKFSVVGLILKTVDILQFSLKHDYNDSFTCVNGASLERKIGAPQLLRCAYVSRFQVVCFLGCDALLWL
jgi:hypothetical protein